MKPLHFANFLAANADKVYAAIAQAVGRQLKRPIRYTPAQSSNDFSLINPDVAFLCGLPYVLMRQQAQPLIELLAAPVLGSERYQNQSVYFSDVIVQRESSYQGFTDLAGCRWAFNEEISYSGYRTVAHFLQQHNLAWDFFGEMVKAGSHQNAIKMVQAGVVDAAAIDSQVLAVAKIQHTDLEATTRSITSIGPSPVPPVVVASHLSSKLKRELRQAFLELHLWNGMKSALHEGNIAHFSAVTDTHYDKIREVIA